MNNLHLEEPAFDEREQAEIIAVAAALQREHGQRATLSDLERAAMEAGIEPRFVREAVTRRQRDRSQPVVIASSAPDAVAGFWRTFAAAALYLPVGAFLLTELGRRMQIGGLHAGFWLLAAAAPALFGFLLPNRSSLRQFAFLWPLFVAFVGHFAAHFPGTRIGNEIVMSGFGVCQGMIAWLAHRAHGVSVASRAAAEVR